MSRRRPKPTEHEGIYSLPSGGFQVRWWTWQIVNGQPKRKYATASTAGGTREAIKLLAKGKANAMTKEECAVVHIEQVGQGLHPTIAFDRSIEDIVSYYKNSSKYVPLEELSKKTVDARIRHFTTFCQDRGIGYVSQFVQIFDDRPSYALQYAEHCKLTRKYKGIATCIIQASSLFKLELKRRDKIITFNPFDEIDKNFDPKDFGNPRVLSVEEIEAINSVATEFDYHMINLCLRSGMRRGAASNLLFAMIFGQVIDWSKHPSWKPKKRRALQYTALNDDVMPSIRYFRLLHGPEAKYVLLGSRAAGDHFIERRLKNVIERARETYPHLKFVGVTPHTLRRSAGFWILKSDGGTMEKAKIQLGHLSEKTTRDSYAFYDTETMVNVANQMQRFERNVNVTVNVTPDQLPKILRKPRKQA